MRLRVMYPYSTILLWCPVLNGAATTAKADGTRNNLAEAERFSSGPCDPKYEMRGLARAPRSSKVIAVSDHSYHQLQQEETAVYTARLWCTTAP